jgi:hypothetical protein
MVTAGNRATIEANASTVGKGGGSEYLHGHAHTITTYYNGITPGGPSRYTSTLNADSTSYGTNVTGSGSSQNLMPYQTVLYIIKL